MSSTSSLDLMQTYGVPGHLRSDNGPEMIAATLRGWLERVGAGTHYLTPGSPSGGETNRDA